MAANSLNAAVELLAADGNAHPAADGSWRRCVETLIEADAAFPSEGKRPSPSRSETVLDAPPLSSPRETASAHLEEIEHALGKIPRVASRAVLLKKVAAWWIGQFGDALRPEWDQSVDHLRESLRQVRGVNHETADRMLLAVAGKPAWPVTRSSIRIACRHGWIDPHAEYDEWQSLFVRGCECDARRMSRLASEFAALGRRHCGPSPHCEGCPLESLLPAAGPIDMTEFDS